MAPATRALVLVRCDILAGCFDVLAFFTEQQRVRLLRLEVSHPGPLSCLVGCR
jgi:hypothetical protein